MRCVRTRVCVCTALRTRAGVPPTCMGAGRPASGHGPGPGAYKINSLPGKPVVAGLQKSGAAWGFGTSKRFSDEFKHQKDNPGPGYYVI